MKVIMIPFAVIISLLSVSLSLFKAAAALLIIAVRFVFDRGFGAAFGAAGGLLLGRRHLKVKVF
ncbi:MAG: hypothetical protein FWE57_08720 [Chitinispirillia bacterium]|nr:hypothetical protein [Chitinispirillia bacterium]